MLSAFPGMDPYLEDPVGWLDVHNTLIGEIRNYLVLIVAPDFRVRIEERVYLVDEDLHDLYIEIVDAASHQVVTAIEVLSPANKVRGSRGYEAMRAKQQALRRGKTHLMIIDLLRAGEREGGWQGRSDYVVTLSRTDTRKHHAWFFDLRDPMPVVALPLRPPYADVPLPLQQIFNTMYDRARYDLTRDYTIPVPPPPLPPADAAWVSQTLSVWLTSQSSVT